MLAIAGGKGGCGKTTTAFGLAVTLAREGSYPLLVDADCDMPDLHHLAGIDRIHDCMGITRGDGVGGVDVLASGTDLRSAARAVDAQPRLALVTGGKRENLNAALYATRHWDGPVLVDCPAGATPIATRPLRHADRTLLVTTDRPQCVEDVRRTAATARELDAGPLGLVVRETDDGTVDPQLLDETILGTLPTVTSSPLADADVERQLDRLARQISTKERFHRSNQTYN